MLKRIYNIYKDSLPVKVVSGLFVFVVFVGGFIQGIKHISSGYATITDPHLTPREKLTYTVNPKDDPENDTINCSELSRYWNVGKNTYVKNNKIFLKPNKNAGAIVIKEPISSFFKLEITFKSSLTTGVNTAITLGNNGGDKIKYAIGDGDFKSIRTYYTNEKTEETSNIETMFLEKEINPIDPITLIINTIEKNEGLRSSAVVKYNQGQTTEDLKIIETFNKKIYLNIWFGINRTLEPENENASLEIISCKLTPKEPSKILNN